MGILDEAIKEHLQLKRQHGAGESELQQIEDEAFGAAERPGMDDSTPDPAAEAPTEFMDQPEAPEGSEASAGRRTEIADLQEPPPPEPAEESQPAEEQAPAMEHEAIAEPEAEPEPPAGEPEDTAGPTTEERHAIAEQPTEMFDVEEEFVTQAEAPSEEELVEEEIAEPRLTSLDPPSAAGDSEEVVEIDDDADEDFWDEKRLSDELDQALEAPIELEEESAPAPAVEGESAVSDSEPGGDSEPEPAREQPEAARSEARDEDVLEETPDFLEEAPEDDELWFEQKPPKDFDFDD